MALMNTIIDLTIFIIFSGIIEFLIFRYMIFANKFQVNVQESKQIHIYISDIVQSDNYDMKSFFETVGDKIVPLCSYEPLQYLLMYIGTVSEETSTKIAEKYSSNISKEKMIKINNSLLHFSDYYSKGYKLESYNTIADIFHNLLVEEDEVIYINRKEISKEFKTISEDLLNNKSSSLYNLLSNYSQIPIAEKDIFLFINSLNDLIYRLRSKLFQGPSYYEFLSYLGKYLKIVADAIERKNSLLLYETYEKIYENAKKRANVIDKQY